jgi:hypothetical protein
MTQHAAIKAAIETAFNGDKNYGEVYDAAIDVHSGYRKLRRNRHILTAPVLNLLAPASLRSDGVRDHSGMWFDFPPEQE